MDDNSLFPFGKTHKGKKMANVPDDYLLWFWGENCEAYRRGELHGSMKEVMMYIDDFFDDLP
jgi:uncharacterized protein (DUF3820 family)